MHSPKKMLYCTSGLTHHHYLFYKHFSFNLYLQTCVSKTYIANIGINFHKLKKSKALYWCLPS